jgi:hypothetical protein
MIAMPMFPSSPSEACIIHSWFCIIHYSLGCLVFALPLKPTPRREAGKRNPSFAQPYAGRGALPHTPQTFFQEKSLTKNLFNRLIF